MTAAPKSGKEGLMKKRLIEAACLQRLSRSIEGGYPSNLLSKDKGVDAFGSLQCSDCFEVAEVPDHMVIGKDSSSAQNVTGRAGYFHGFPHIV